MRSRGMRAIACSFSAGLDDLPRKLHRDPVAVLRVLKASGRFSCFEATCTTAMAIMMTRLCHKGMTIKKADGSLVEYGRLILTDNVSCCYPWTKVTLTAAGEQLLADNPAGVLNP